MENIKTMELEFWVVPEVKPTLVITKRMPSTSAVYIVLLWKDLITHLDPWIVLDKNILMLL